MIDKLIEAGRGYGMEINVDKTKTMRISRQPTPLQITLTVENVEEFNYLDSMITNDARCTREIKTRIAMAKAAFFKKKTLHQQTILSAKEETSEVLHLEHSLVWCGNLDSSETRSEIPRKFLNVVLEKDGEDKLDGPPK
jgi:hypothetical protein